MFFTDLAVLVDLQLGVQVHYHLNIPQGEKSSVVLAFRMVQV